MIISKANDIIFFINPSLLPDINIAGEERTVGSKLGAQLGGAGQNLLDLALRSGTLRDLLRVGERLPSERRQAVEPLAFLVAPSA